MPLNRMEDSARIPLANHRELTRSQLYLRLFLKGYKKALTYMLGKAFIYS